MAETIKMFRGDDEDFAFQVKDSAGTPIDTTGWSFKFTAKLNDSDTSNVIQKTTGSGITEVDAMTGQYTIAIAAADTVGVSAGTLVYDIEATTAAAKIKTVAKGALVISQDVTT